MCSVLCSVLCSAAIVPRGSAEASSSLCRGALLWLYATLGSMKLVFHIQALERFKLGPRQSFQFAVHKVDFVECVRSEFLEGKFADK